MITITASPMKYCWLCGPSVNRSCLVHPSSHITLTLSGVQGVVYRLWCPVYIYYKQTKRLLWKFSCNLCYIVYIVSMRYFEGLLVVNFINAHISAKLYSTASQVHICHVFADKWYYSNRSAFGGLKILMINIMYAVAVSQCMHFSLRGLVTIAPFMTSL